MSESSQHYKELAIPYFREVFEIIDDVLKNREILYYLIGVSAIALEMLRKGIKPARGTKDIDFAIMISSLDQFEEVVNDLEEVGFNKVEAPWTLVHPDYDVVIDLLPFGEIEQNNTVGFNERYTALHVLGFKEVMKDSQEYEIEDRVVHVPPLPGMIILKLVAWSDRPEDRANDPYDILRIIEHYNDLEFEQNMAEHHDLIPDDGEFDERLFSARILGRKAKTYLDESGELETRILDVLNENTVVAEKSRIAKAWARKNGWELEYGVSLLEEFEKGLLEGIS
jgi:predicted nucleotidyltransferase